MGYSFLTAHMWVWTKGEPVIILYSLDSDGKMIFHSIKPVPEMASD